MKRAEAEDHLSWVRLILAAAIMLAVAVDLIRATGMIPSLKGIDHVKLAYLAGALWLTK